MTTENKKTIKEDLKKYVTRFPSQNQAANSLKNISPGTVSQILNEKWDLISEDMWRNLASQLATTLTTSMEWQTVEINDFKMLTNLLNEAQKHSLSMGIIGNAGSGKSVAQRIYAQSNKNAYLLSCSEFWNKKYFLSELLTVMGVDFSGLTVSEMMYEVVRKIKTKETPIIILDEADKLTDQVLYFYITLFNLLEDQCGIVLCATDHLKKRLDRGRKLNKKGYNEIYSRIGRKFVELRGVTMTDVHQICFANGIEDKAKIKLVWDECESDLRRVKRKIHAIKQQLNGN